MNYELRLTKIYEDKDRTQRTQRYEDRRTKKTERPKNRKKGKTEAGLARWGRGVGVGHHNF